MKILVTALLLHFLFLASGFAEASDGAEKVCLISDWKNLHKGGDKRSEDLLKCKTGDLLVFHGYKATRMDNLINAIVRVCAPETITVFKSNPQQWNHAFCTYTGRTLPTVNFK